MKTVIFAGLLLLVALVQAKKPAPLPDFPLTTTDGNVVNFSKLHLPDHWLLFYVNDNSGYSTAVLDALRNEPPSALNGKMLVIVSGAAGKDIAPFAARYPHLKTVTWYADPKRDALRALSLRGAPTVLGVRQDTIQWMLTGALADPSRLTAILRSWKNAKNK